MKLRCDFKTEKAYLKYLDAQLKYWADTQKEHDEAQADLARRRELDNHYQAVERRNDDWFRWYMKNVNGK
jgi:hypothetical protein